MKLFFRLLPHFVILCGLFGAISCSSGGGCSSDDDSSVDDDSFPALDDSSPATDDSAADDDTSADDATSDDSGADDSGGDDSDDDMGEPPEGLFIVVQGSIFTKSYLFEEGDWKEFAVPVPPICSLIHPCFFGPSFVLDGQKGYASWGVIGLGYPSEPMTLEHDWADFDPETGWSLNLDRPPAGQNCWTQLMSVPAQGDMWAADFTIFTSAYFAVHHLENGAFIQKLAADEFLALEFMGPDFGIITGFNLLPSRPGSSVHEPFLLQWDSADFNELPYPAVFGDFGILHAKYADAANGFAVLTSFDMEQRAVAELSDGVWSLVPAPAGCSDSLPGYVNFVGDHVFVSPYGMDEDDHIWERIDGSWRCRRPDSVQPPVTYITHLVILTTGESYIGTLTVEGANRHVRLFEIMGHGFQEISLPGDFKGLNAMHAFGPNAQHYSSNMINPL